MMLSVTATGIIICLLVTTVSGQSGQSGDLRYVHVCMYPAVQEIHGNQGATTSQPLKITVQYAINMLYSQLAAMQTSACVQLNYVLEGVYSKLRDVTCMNSQNAMDASLGKHSPTSLPCSCSYIISYSYHYSYLIQLALVLVPILQG